jgi:hypothetical protein
LVRSFLSGGTQSSHDGRRAECYRGHQRLASDQVDTDQILSNVLKREVKLESAIPELRTSTAEEYWPDIEGLDHRDTVTDFGLPEGAFFDCAVVHLLAKATVEFMLALGWEPSEIYVGTERGAVGGLDIWRDLFLRELNARFAGDSVRTKALEDTFSSLDQGKRFVFDGSTWLKQQLFGNP